MRHDLSAAHPLLDRIRQLPHQRQPAAHPAHAAVEAPGQLVLAQPEAPLQLVEQPSLLERRLVARRAHLVTQHQRLRLPELQPRRQHRVAHQLPQTPHALVAVDHHRPRRRRVRHHHDRYLLARRRQRRQQLPLARRTQHAQPLVAKLQLPQLQIHRSHPAEAFLRGHSACAFNDELTRSERDALAHCSRAIARAIQDLAVGGRGVTAGLGGLTLSHQRSAFAQRHAEIRKQAGT